MAEHQTAQNTITFLPERLNRRPAVFRGMTLYEMFIVLSLSLSIGLIIGLGLLLFGLSWPMIPTSMFVAAFIGIRTGGFYLSRLKRGKPDSWLDRFVDFKLRKGKYITTAQHWSIKRTPKSPAKPKGKKS